MANQPLRLSKIWKMPADSKASPVQSEGQKNKPQDAMPQAQRTPQQDSPLFLESPFPWRRYYTASRREWHRNKERAIRPALTLSDRIPGMMVPLASPKSTWAAKARMEAGQGNDEPAARLQRACVRKLEGAGSIAMAPGAQSRDVRGESM